MLAEGPKAPEGSVQLGREPNPPGRRPFFPSTGLRPRLAHKNPPRTGGGLMETEGSILANHRLFVQKLGSNPRKSNVLTGRPSAPYDDRKDFGSGLKFDGHE